MFFRQVSMTSVSSSEAVSCEAIALSRGHNLDMEATPPGLKLKSLSTTTPNKRALPLKLLTATKLQY